MAPVTATPPTRIALREATVDGFLRKSPIRTRTRLAARVGKTPSHITRVLSGERPCDWTLLSAIAMALEVMPEEIADFAVEAVAA